MKRKIRIGALVSGGGTNLQAIIDACDDGRINGEVAFVGSDRPDAKGLGRAGKHNIPVFAVDYRRIISGCHEASRENRPPADFDLEDIRRKQGFFGPDVDGRKVEMFLTTRAMAEHLLLEEMRPFAVDLLVLAGFMRNLTPYFIDRFNSDCNRPNIMNIHPALLPAFPGTDGYGDTFRYGCKVGGCTVHFIDYGEDSGPIIGQRAFSITERDDLDAIRRKGLELEWKLYPECIRMFAEGRLQVVTMTHTLCNRKVVRQKVVKIAESR